MHTRQREIRPRTRSFTWLEVVTELRLDKVAHGWSHSLTQALVASWSPDYLETQFQLPWGLSEGGIVVSQRHCLFGGNDPENLCEKSAGQMPDY